MKAVISFICFGALMWSRASSTPTPTPQFPEKYWGFYESQPENDQNFAEFVEPFHLPATISINKPNIFFVRREGEHYHATINFGPSVPPFELKFKLGEAQTTTINGKNVEFVYTFENGDENPILKAKFRDTESDLKFTVDATFTPTGFNALYVREGVTARRTYTRIPNPSVPGFYENVPEKQSPNFIAFANQVFPAPKGLSWDSNTGLWLGRHGKDFIVKYLITPSVHVKFPFQLNQQRTKEIAGHNVTYTYTLVGENYTTKTTTIHGEFKCESGVTLTVDAVSTPEGITATYKSGDQTATRYYRRALSGLAYGTFENVPEASENWAEFATASGKENDSTERTQLQIYRHGTSLYFRVFYASGKSSVYPFVLNQPQETTAPNGTPIKYTYTEKPSYSNDALLHLQYEYSGKTFTVDLTFNQTGVYNVYRNGPITARRFYRRVIPAIALGTFESNPTTPEFTQFTESTGLTDLNQKCTVELTQTPTYTYNQQFTIQGGQPTDFPFNLGQQFTTSIKGKTVNYNYYYFDYPTPVIHTYWSEANKGPLAFSVAAEFTPTGYTATYLYKGKLATRSYTRVGAPVPPPTYPTA